MANSKEGTALRHSHTCTDRSLEDLCAGPKVGVHIKPIPGHHGASGPHPPDQPVNTSNSLLAPGDDAGRDPLLTSVLPHAMPAAPGNVGSAPPAAPCSASPRAPDHSCTSPCRDCAARPALGAPPAQAKYCVCKPPVLSPSSRCLSFLRRRPPSPTDSSF
jgi:hypothetical protein